MSEEMKEKFLEFAPKFNQWFDRHHEVDRANPALFLDYIDEKLIDPLIHMVLEVFFGMGADDMDWHPWDCNTREEAQEWLDAYLAYRNESSSN